MGKLSKIENLQALVALRVIAREQGKPENRPPTQIRLLNLKTMPDGSRVKAGLLMDEWERLGLTDLFPYAYTMPQLQVAVERLGKLGFMLPRGGTSVAKYVPKAKAGRPARKTFQVLDAGFQYAATLTDDWESWETLELPDEE